MSETLLQAKGIEKTYRKGPLAVPVLKGVDFSVAKGETVAIMGASGAGKSTLLHVLGTLDEPSAGQVMFGGKNIFSGGEEERSRFRNRNLGFVFQFHHLLPEFSAMENVMMPGLIAGRDESSMKQEATRLLTEVGLAHRLWHKPGELSGGECQRAAVARALMMKPSILMGDELTGNLDSENARILVDMLLELNSKTGVALVVVTHDQDVAKRMSRIVELKDGRIM